MKDPDLLFRKGSFIAVRHETGWWLAQLYTHVSKGSEKARIRWFDEEVDLKRKTEKVFRIHECNDIPAKSIICTVQTTRVSSKPTKVSVDTDDCQLIEAFLLQSKTPSTSTQPPKEVSRKTRKAGNKKLNRKKVTSRQKPLKSTTLQKAKRQAASKALVSARKKKISFYSNISLYETNPIYDSKTPIPQVAPSVNSLLFTRAVFNRDYAKVEKLASDLDSFSSQSYPYVGGYSNDIVIKSSWHHAIDARDKQMIKLLYNLQSKEDKLKKSRVANTSSLLSIIETGTYNPASLGVEYIRPLTMARGSREGANAFKSLPVNSKRTPSISGLVSYAVAAGCNTQFVKFLKLTLDPTNPNFNLLETFQCAVLHNNRDVAANIAKESLACGDTDSFNQLHYEVLAFNKYEKLSPFKSVNCHKKTNYYYGKITPLHSATLNPNITYLKQMLKENPQLEIQDSAGNRPIHYAAIASTAAATKYLLDSNISPLTVNANGETPLMWAAKQGSVVNIMALIGHAYAEHYQTKQPGPIDTSRIVDIDLIKTVTKEARRSIKTPRSTSDDEDEDGGGAVAAQQLKKQGIGGIELAVVKGPIQSYTALTLAVEHGHHEAASVLLDLGADPNKPTGAAKRRVPPICIAAKYGYLEILKTLILHGAKVRAKDRHGCTAFHYAAKYNQLHCLSWLAANAVSDASYTDSSGNTALQYACAEGFILVVKYLVDELKVDVSIKNSWGMSALEIAVLRQQKGVVEYLLDNANVDLNFRDNSGATLVMKLCAAAGENALQLLNYLMSKPYIDVLAVDNNGCNALHYMASQKVGRADPTDSNIEICLTGLLEDGLDINSKTNNGKTALHIAISNKRGYSGRLNVNLICAFIRGGADIKDIRMEDNRNILQYFTASSRESGLSIAVIDAIESTCTPAVLKELATHVDDDGMTALLIAAQKCTVSSKQSTFKDGPWKILDKLIGSGFLADINSEVKPRKVKSKDECSCSKKEENHKRNCPRYPYTEHGKFRALNFMMKYGALEDVRRILTYKLDLNYVDCEGMYPLHHAIVGGRGNKSLIPLLIKHGACIDILPGPGICSDNKHHNCPVLVLAAMFCIDIVLPLVEAGACILAGAPDGRTVLHHIVSNYTDLPTRITIAEKLLPMIENINDTDNEGNSYLHHAVMGIEHGSNVSIEMISILLLMGADPCLMNTKGQTPLHFAFLSNDDYRSSTFSDPIEVVSILTHVMDKNIIKAGDFYHGFTPLHLSAMRGGSVTSMHLIAHGCEIDELDNQGNTPLTLAVNGNHQSCVLMLIQKGASIDRSVCYPIFRKEPCVYNKKESVKEAVNYTWLPLKEMPLISPPKVFSSNLILYKVIGHEWQGVLFTLVDLLQQSFVPLEAAITLRKFNLAITLMLKFGKSLKPADCNDIGQTLLHCLCLTSSKSLELQQRLLNLLLKFEYSVSAKDSVHKCTPLHYSCLMSKFELSKLLIKPNTINCKDVFGRTPVCALFWNNSFPCKDFLRYLVKNGASLEVSCDFNIQESTYPLFDHTFDTKRSDYFTSYSHRYTVLIKAIIEDNLDYVKLLLWLGADIDTANSTGMTALMYAAKLNRVDIFKLLMNAVSSKSYLCQSDEGRTVLHYTVLSHPEVELADPIILKSAVAHLVKTKQLAQSVEVKDVYGKSVLGYCKGFVGYLRIVDRSNKHTRANDVSSTVLELQTSSPDFASDCDKFFSFYHQEQGTSPEAIPDPCLSLKKHECEVYQDENGNYFDILMTKIDIKLRTHGIYNFYKLQLIKNKGKDIYLLLTRWGRIGDEGQHQETPFPTLEECKTEFMKVFKAKTKNEWSDIDQFINHPGKYRLVSREKRYHNQYKKIKYDFKEYEKPETLDQNVFDTLLEAANPTELNKLLEDDFKLNVSQLPFGFIKQEVLDDAEKILADIAKLVKETNHIKNNLNITKSDNQTKFMSKTQEIYDLTNELYHLIPQNGYGITEIRPINNETAINEWTTKIKNIKNLEVVNRILAGSQQNMSTTHPVQYIYNSIDCEILPLDEHDMITQYLVRNIYCAAPNARVSGIYRLNRHKQNATKSKGEKQLLYHGITTGTLLSILKRGLQNAPYGRTYGTLFGDGIYLADNFAKSLTYARGSKSKFVLVVSVAKGNVHKAISESMWGNTNVINPPKESCDTLWVMGKLQQNTTHDMIMPAGERFGMATFEQVKREDIKVPKKEDSTGNSCTGIFAFPGSDTHSESNEDSEMEIDEDAKSEEEMDQDKDNNTDGNEDNIISEQGYRYLPEHSEFVIKNSANITLEYLVKIGKR